MSKRRKKNAHLEPARHALGSTGSGAEVHRGSASRRAGSLARRRRASSRGPARRPESLYRTPREVQGGVGVGGRRGRGWRRGRPVGGCRRLQPAAPRARAARGPRRPGWSRSGTTKNWTDAEWDEELKHGWGGYAPGATVVIEGIKAMPQLNGRKRGKLLRFDGASLRWQVEIEDGQGTKALKPDNLVVQFEDEEDEWAEGEEEEWAEGDEEEEDGANGDTAAREPVAKKAKTE
ncbi:unnamed protein product [Prorocentrum cordatum]|uniref:Uncharacterized protein n=1 Tax=Prorocentrum cordatum TaxID=2364126 RepID=A0ABN9RWE2_9DINO|nr:unnamed protein product [Polarella glacialis]